MSARKQTAEIKILLTSEHGGNAIPSEFEYLFKDAKAVLSSHRGFDLGSLDLYKALKSLSDFHLSSEQSRLLIELNRSLHHRSLFSEFSKTLTDKDKKHLIEHFYLPYRNEVERWIQSQLTQGHCVLHFSIHSFTPELNGVKRNADIGLLYDPKRKIEKDLCGNLAQAIKRENIHLKIRMNYPYLGTADGFTSYLRKKFPQNYAGIELEVNQKYVESNKLDVSLKESIFSAMKEILVDC